MKNKISYLPAKHQQGVGLIEVLVAMLVLAIGVLGFAALQVKSVAATAESMQKTQAINIIAGFVDQMHLNVRRDTGVTAKNYADLVNTTQANPGCGDVLNPCSPQKIAQKDVFDLQTQIKDVNMQAHMEVCKGFSNSVANNTKYCLFVAWDKTDISTSGYGGSTTCMTTNGTAYYANATCVMMEAI